MEWRKNRVAIGAVVFFALLGVTLFAVSSTKREPSSSAELPSLKLDKDAITALDITRPQNERVVISKIGEVWRITDPLDAPADQSNVESALNRLADLRITRIVATQPESYARLQVDDANAVKVIVRAGEETLAELIVGKYGGGVTMVRIDEHAEVFGASGSLRYAFDRELKSWRNRKVVSFETAEVQKIRFQNDSGTFEFERTEDGWNAIRTKPTLRDFDPKKVTGLVSTAARLTASDFASKDISPARAGLSKPKATVTLTTKDGPQAIVLEVGDVAENTTDVYLRRNDDPTIYLISKYLADRLRPDAKAFERLKEPPPPAMTEEHQEPQLPPEVLKQLKDKITEQQQAP
jgi:hypothetical protein